MSSKDGQILVALVGHVQRDRAMLTEAKRPIAHGCPVLGFDLSDMPEEHIVVEAGRLRRYG